MRQGGLTLAAGRVRSKKKESKKKTPKIHPTQNTPQQPQQPGDCDNVETAREILPRVIPYSLDSLDAGFVEIGLVAGFVEIGFVQLSRSVKTTNVHTP